MHSLVLALALAAGLQAPAATPTTATCDFVYTSAYAGHSACLGGTGFQHRAYGVCYVTGPVGPGGVSEYVVIGPWAGPTAKSRISCRSRFDLLVSGDFELRPAP